jgi:inner membrane protein
MDPITHGLAGAATGFVLAGRKLGLRAAGIGAVAGLAPDVDFFIRSGHEPLLYVEFHRQFTHSLLFAPLGALLVSLIWVGRPRFRSDWLVIWGCALGGWVSHSLLDASTTYGTVLLWPFSEHRFSWNLISIIDPLFTIPLALLLIAGLKFQRRLLVAGGLAFCGVYLAVGGVQRERAAFAQRFLAEQRGHLIERSELMPGFANNLVWRGLYEFDGRIYSDRVRVGWFSAPMVCEGKSLPRATLDSLTPFERSRNEGHSAFERFSHFSNYWVARSPFDPRVFGDMRYSLSLEDFDPVWGIQFTEPGAPVNYVWISRTRERQIDRRKMWEEITGRDPCYRPLDELAPWGRIDYAATREQLGASGLVSGSRMKFREE